MDDTSESDTRRRRTVVSELGRRALEGGSLDQLLSEACTAVAERVGADRASAFERVAADEGRLRADGGPDQRCDERRVSLSSDSPSGRALRSGETVADDVGTDGRFADAAFAADRGVRSAVAVPIGADGDPWGVLGAYDAEPAAFTDRDAAFLRDVANVLAAAIERRFDETRDPGSEERYRALFESLDQGFCILEVLFDDNGTPVDYYVVEANDAFGEYTGLEDADGKAVSEFDAEIEQHWYERHERVVRSREPVRFEERVEAWGKWFDGYAFPVGDPTENYVAVLFEDVTERKRRERELELFRNLLDHSTDSVYVIDPESGRILDANATARQRTGYSRDELLELTVPELEREIPDRESWRDVVWGVRAGDLETFDGIRRCADGSSFPVEVSLSYVELDREYVLAIVRDVTERRKRERELEASNERLEQFAYAASHDLQEPLRMVSSYLRLIEKRYGDDLDEDAEEFLAFAVDGADRMRAMIDGLLEYSRVESNGDPFEPVELDALLADVCDDLQLPIEERGAEITTGGLPRVQGDPTQLRQLLQNLLDNAVEYGGESPQVRVTAEREGSTWRLSVRDDGIGIPREEQERVFRIFRRLHTDDEHAGTGIGLALCQRIIERHDGEIGIDSEPGKGTTVSLTLPAADGSDRASEKES